MFNVISVTLFLAATVKAALSPSSIGSDLSILIHNDLLGSYSLLSHENDWYSMPLQKAIETCHSLGETLWSYQAGVSEIKNDLDYLTFQGKYSESQKFWIAPIHNTPSTINAYGKVQRASANTHLPAFCTQSAPYSNSDSQDTSSRWQVSVRSNNEYLTGFRDRVSFRFLGIRYAPQPKRWTYSQLYEGTELQRSRRLLLPECLDAISSQIQPPKKEDLKPVMFWIHGGAFQTGTGSDPTVDGGNLASRGDVVVVTTNYRLGNLGFLALDDGATNGNYGLADQIIALEWVQRNIRDFGGDPDRVTIFGQSAGAGSVRALLASPKSRGKFAGAVMLSNLGGIAEEMEVVGNDILSETNCTNANSRIDCLRELSASTIINLSASARYLVVDGEYLQAPELGLTNPRTTANVPLLLGTTRDDGAAFIAYPSDNETIQEFLNASDLPSNVVPSPLFPVPSGTNHTLDIFNTSARICTDGVFRCIDQATAYAGLKNHIFPSIFFYEFNRTYQMPGWSPNPPLCQAPITPEFPYGDPSMEYFKCHSGELYYVFGNILRVGLPLRDDYDLPFEQYVLDSWASFARSADPTPDSQFLKAR
ncbi:hypothetical protein N7451_003454, partial [Penicillium sp. IBT 35674x]